MNVPDPVGARVGSADAPSNSTNPNNAAPGARGADSRRDEFVGDTDSSDEADPEGTGAATTLDREQLTLNAHYDAQALSGLASPDDGGGTGATVDPVGRTDSWECADDDPDVGCPEKRSGGKIRYYVDPDTSSIRCYNCDERGVCVGHGAPSLGLLCSRSSRNTGLCTG